MNIRKTTLVLLAILAFVGMSTLFSVNNDVLHAQSVPGCSPSTTSQCVLSTGTTSTTLTTDTQVIAAQNTGLRLYITDAACVNTSASTVTAAALKNGSTSVYVIPCPPAGATGGRVVFDPPLRMGSTATAFNMAAISAVSTAYFSARGYSAK